MFISRLSQVLGPLYFFNPHPPFVLQHYKHLKSRLSFSFSKLWWICRVNTIGEILWRMLWQMNKLPFWTENLAFAYGPILRWLGHCHIQNLRVSDYNTTHVDAFSSSQVPLYTRSISGRLRWPLPLLFSPQSICYWHSCHAACSNSVRSSSSIVEHCLDRLPLLCEPTSHRPSQFHHHWMDHLTPRLRGRLVGRIHQIDTCLYSFRCKKGVRSAWWISSPA